MSEDNTASLAAALRGIKKDLISGLLEFDGEIDRDDYVAAMIDKPLAEIDAIKVGRGLVYEDLAILEDAGRALASDIRNGIIVSASPEITTSDYVETVLAPLVGESETPKP